MDQQNLSKDTKVLIKNMKKKVGTKIIKMIMSNKAKRRCHKNI